MKKIKLKFMDMVVEIADDQKTEPDSTVLENTAYNLLGLLVSDRLRFNELCSELDQDTDEELPRKLNSHIHPDIMYG